MLKKTLGLTLLVCLSGSALASTDIVIDVPFDDKKFCIYEGKAYGVGSQIKPIKKLLTCREAKTPSNTSNIAIWK